MRTSWTAGVVLALALGGSLAGGESDRDGDGLSDALENELLERFRPRFHVSPADCAELPAELEAFSVEPRVEARNGTLYARVSPSTVLGSDVVALELHYYHLWERDCGPLNAHPLDVEHVSTLVVASATRAAASEWTSMYWYAAAHEDTVCDASNAAHSDALGAVAAGPNVWISDGKHASFLSCELCGQRGCGGDDCSAMTPLPRARVNNIGEAGAPLDGAVWIASRDWPLYEKLDTDFDADLLARLEASDPKVLARVNGHWRLTQFSISIGGDTIGALTHAGEHGGGGVAKADQQTKSALGKAFRAVGRTLGRVVGMGSEDGDEP